MSTCAGVRRGGAVGWLMMTAGTRADHERAVRALTHLDREAATWVAHAAGVLGADDLVLALIDAHPDGAAAIRGAVRLGRRSEPPVGAAGA